MTKNASTANSFENAVLRHMLDTAVGGLVENEICSYCKIRFDEHEKLKKCRSLDWCKSLIYQELEQQAKDCLKHKEKKS